MSVVCNQSFSTIGEKFFNIAVEVIYRSCYRKWRTFHECNYVTRQLDDLPFSLKQVGLYSSKVRYKQLASRLGWPSVYISQGLRHVVPSSQATIVSYVAPSYVLGGRPTNLLRLG